MIATFQGNRILAYQILGKNQNVGHSVYLQFLAEVLQPRVRRMHNHRSLILHDNARPHKHKEIKDFFNLHRWVEMNHPLTALIFHRPISMDLPE